MSKGNGRIEGYVIGVLNQRGAYGPGASVVRAVAASLGRPVSPALDASVRRALGSLKRKGAVVQDETRMWMLAAEYRRQQAANARASKRRPKEEEKHRRRAREETDAEDMHLWPIEATSAPPEIQRLARILGMLGSDHDGEVIAAGRQAEALRRRMGKDWISLLSAARDPFYML